MLSDAGPTNARLIPRSGNHKSASSSRKIKRAFQLILTAYQAPGNANAQVDDARSRVHRLDNGSREVFRACNGYIAVLTGCFREDQTDDARARWTDGRSYGPASSEQDASYQCAMDTRGGSGLSTGSIDFCGNLVNCGTRKVGVTGVDGSVD
jgi:hypothetical protein